MQPQTHVSLKSHNTMRLDSQAAFFIEPTSIADVQILQSSPLIQKAPPIILGEGSNTLLSKDISSLVIHPRIMGREVIDQTDEHVVIKLGAGENWHDFVAWAVANNWGGVENLALIPGSIGAAPVQNIAAYGQAQADTFKELEAIELTTGKLKTFTHATMQFAYRDSLFKHLDSGSHVIVSVTYQLAKHPDINTSYYSIGRRRDSISQELAKLGPPPYTIKDTYNAVCSIRKSKLPDWNTTPTFGSFFKNPIISIKDYHQLQHTISDLQSYPVDNLTYKQQNDPDFKHSEFVKIPVGRLLDFLGWADRPIGHVSTYNKWASIVTHDGLASGQEIKAYTDAMRLDVYDHFKIKLEHEVVII